MPQLKPKRPFHSNVLTEDAHRASTQKLIRTRVRPPEMLPHLEILACGTIPQMRDRISAMHRYVGARRPFTELEKLELNILHRKLTFALMMQQGRC